MMKPGWKEQLGTGPWQDEPDRVEFYTEGLPCLIKRSSQGNWCGYVAVPPGHPWYDKHYNEIDVDVHGGLTYAARCAGEICHVPKSGETEDVYWLGFDCAHAGDFVPYMVRFQLPELHGRDIYRDQSYWTRETQRLARQAKDAEAP